MEETRVLYMTFRNEAGNSCTLSLDSPRTDVTEQEIINAMNTIKTLNIFRPKGYDLVDCIGAKIVNAETTEFDLNIEIPPVPEA